MGREDCGDCGRLDPMSLAWAMLSAAGAPSPRSAPIVAVGGRRVLIFGGTDDGLVTIDKNKEPHRSVVKGYSLDDGAIYDADTDAWTPLPAAPCGPRKLADVVWTGSEFILWGGYA